MFYVYIVHFSRVITETMNKNQQQLRNDIVSSVSHYMYYIICTCVYKIIVHLFKHSISWGPLDLMVNVWLFPNILRVKTIVVS